jgi:type I restriction enzyme R subunit
MSSVSHLANGTKSLSRYSRRLHAPGDALGYDRARALFPADLLAWVQTTQPEAWEALTKNHGAAAESVLLDRVRKQLDERGTLDVLRHRVELLGLRQTLAPAQFKPALAMNPATLARYAATARKSTRRRSSATPQ